MCGHLWRITTGAHPQIRYDVFTYDVNTCINEKINTHIWYIYTWCENMYEQNESTHVRIIYVCDICVSMFEVIFGKWCIYIYIWCIIYVCGFFLYIFSHLWQIITGAHPHIRYAIYTYDINTCTNLKTIRVYRTWKYVYCMNMLCIVCIFVVTSGELALGPIHTSDMKYFNVINMRVHVK